MKTPPDDLADRLLGASELILAGSPPPRFDDIAERIGVARATLYYYFSGRDDLLTFVLTEHIRRGAAVIAAADDGGSPADRLRVTVAGLVRFLGENPELCPALLGAMGGAGRMREALEANESMIATPLRQLIADGMAAGEFAEGDVADITAALIGAVLLPIVSRSMRAEPIVSDEAVTEVTDIAMRVVARAGSPGGRARRR